jgi:SAM-dependent methyltransferase
VEQDIWEVGGAYEAYVGRWSRRVAALFVPGLAVPPRRNWLDVGCGTGALSATVLARADPVTVVGVDPSEGFLAEARSRIGDPRASFRVADARALPFPDDSFAAVVSGLALNFVPDPARAVAEFTRVTRRGGKVSAYVWDYAEGMEMMRYFWDAATAVDPAAAERDEGRRFPLCQPEPLSELWTGAGLDAVGVRAIEIRTVFTGFDDFWRPFLGGQGSAPGYVASLTDDRRAAVRDLLRERLPAGPRGSIALTARAWVVHGYA